MKTSVNKNDNTIENQTVFKTDSSNAVTANKKTSLDEIPTSEKTDSGITELKGLFIPSSYKFNWALGRKENVSDKLVKEFVALSHDNLLSCKIHNAHPKKEIELFAERLSELNLTDKQNTERRHSSQDNESKLNEAQLNLIECEDNTTFQSSSNSSIKSSSRSILNEEKLDLIGFEENTKEPSNSQEDGSNFKEGILRLRRYEDITSGHSNVKENESNSNKGKFNSTSCENNTTRQISCQEDLNLNKGILDLRGCEDNTTEQTSIQENESNMNKGKLDLIGCEDNVVEHSNRQENKSNMNEEKFCASTFEDREETRNIEALSEKTKKNPTSVSQKTHITNPPTETVSRKCLRAHRRKPQSESKTVLTVNNKGKSKENTVNSERTKAVNLENTISTKIRNSSVVSKYENSQMNEPSVINNTQVENSNHSLCENNLTQIIKQVNSLEQNHKELNLKPNYDEFQEVEQEVPCRKNKERSESAVSATYSVPASNISDRNKEGINKEHQNIYENKTALQVVPSVETEVKKCGRQSTPKTVPQPLPIPPAQNESSIPRTCLHVPCRQHPAIDNPITIGSNKEINQEELKGKNDRSIENQTVFKMDSSNGDKANKKTSLDEIPTLEKKDSGIAELKGLFIPSSYQFKWALGGKENVSDKLVKEFVALSHDNLLSCKIHNAHAKKEVELFAERLSELNLTECKHNTERRSSGQDNESTLNEAKLNLIECEDNTTFQSSSNSSIKSTSRSILNEEKLDLRGFEENTKEPSSSQEDGSNFKEEILHLTTYEDITSGHSNVKEKESNSNKGKLDSRSCEDNTASQITYQEDLNLNKGILDLRGCEDNTTEQTSIQENESNMNKGKLHFRRSQENAKGQNSSQKNESNLKEKKFHVSVSEENINDQSIGQKYESTLKEDKFNIRASENNTKEQSNSHKIESNLKEEKLYMRGYEENNTKSQKSREKIESNLKDDKLGIRGSGDDTKGKNSIQQNESNMNKGKLDLIGCEDNAVEHSNRQENKSNMNEEKLSTFEDREETRNIEALSEETKKNQTSVSQKTRITNPPTETVSRKCLRAHRRKPQSESKTVLTVNNKGKSKENTVKSERTKAVNLENTISTKIRNSSVVSKYENSQMNEPPVINNTQVENSNHSLCENNLTQIIKQVNSLEQNNMELNLKPNYDEIQEVEQGDPNRKNEERSESAVSANNYILASNIRDRNKEGINKEHQNIYENKKALQVVPSVEKEIKQSGSQSTPKAVPQPLPIPPAQNQSSIPRTCLHASCRQHPATDNPITIGNNKEINQEELKGNNYNRSIAESGPTPSTSKDNAHISLPEKNVDRVTNNHNENAYIINTNSESLTLSCDGILMHSNAANSNMIVNPDARKSEKTKNKSLIKGNKETERGNPQTTTSNEEKGVTAVRNDGNESVCSICLEPCNGKAVTNPCLHEFCYTCILQWSEVKPECPLCKRLFSSILHNIKGDDKYDVQLIPQSSITAEYETNTRVADAPSVVPQSSSQNYLQRFVSNDRLAFHYCPICYRACSSANVLALHLHSEHNDRHISEPRPVSTSRTHQNAYESTSRTSCAQQNAYESTFRIPAQESAYECKICGRVCASGAGLASHMRMHARNNETPSTSKANLPIASKTSSTYVQKNSYECNICGKLCASGAGLVSHMMAHARNDTPSAYSGSHYGRPNTYEYGNGISNESVWASTPSTSRTPSRASSYSQPSGYSCSVCGRSCASGAGLASHMRAHSRRGEY